MSAWMPAEMERWFNDDDDCERLDFTGKSVDGRMDAWMVGCWMDASVNA